jgi:predicted branched-subunit amino acid permease
MFTAVFTALLVGLWKGKTDLLPWAVAAGVAVAAAQWLPGKWYILLGGLAGSLVGAWRDGR